MLREITSRGVIAEIAEGEIACRRRGQEERRWDNW